MKIGKRLRNAKAALFGAGIQNTGIAAGSLSGSHGNGTLGANPGNIRTDKAFTLSEACDILQKYRDGYSAKFDETVEFLVKLGIDPKKPEHNVRGMISMPHSTGKKVAIAAFVDPSDSKKAIDAGADMADFDQLNSDVKSGKINFDVYVASTEMMPKIMHLAKILGPKGLMPSAKAGTSGSDIVKIVKDIKGGQIAFKASKEGNVNIGVGKLSFTKDAISANVRALYDMLLSLKPATVKKKYVLSVHISTSQGISIPLSSDLA